MGVPIALGYKEDDASGAQVIDGGLRFDSSKSQRLVRTPSSTGNRKTFTLSLWTKRNALGGAGQPSILAVPVGSNDNDYFQFGFYQDNLYMFGYSTLFRITSPKYRDISGWYHLVFAADTTQTDNNDRMKFYVNGIRVTDFSTNNTITQYADLGVNRTAVHNIGIQDTSYPYDGHMSQFYLIDGQALDPSYFGYTDPLTNTWRPKKYNSPLRKLNDGTTWNSTYSDAFLGYVMTDSALVGSYTGLNGSITITLSSSVTVTSSLRLNLYANVASFATYTTVSINGTSQTGNMTLIQSTGTNSGIWEVSGFSGTLTSITLGAQNGANNGISRVIVDGVTLINGINDPNSFGRNGFYLPFDGNSPIGQDQSGRGNNWTPVNFGGSNTLEKATGALPILNTDGGGKVARVGVRTDSNASSLVLALPLVGIKSDFSNAINSGTSNKTVTVTNAVASSTQSNFYGGSFAFDGNGDYLVVSENSELLINGTECTIEGWYYVNSSFAGNEGSSLPLFAQVDVSNTSTSGSANFWSFADATYLYFGSSGGYMTVSKSLIPIGKWFHYAAVVTGTTNAKLFIDGVLVGSGTIGAIGSNSGRTTNLGIIRSGGGGSPSYLNGYIQDFRIYKGVAKYTQNFIPASTDPDILPDTPSGVSYSSNVALVPSTDGAVAFDGSGDYLSLADSADWALGSGDFTIEAFVYAYSFGSFEGIVGQWPQNGGNVANSFVFEAVSGNIEFYYSVGSTLYGPISGGALTQRKWQHLAAVRSGNTMYIFVDGILTGSGSVSLTFNDAASPLTVGGNIAGGGSWNGFISNLHIVKGTALYTSNFTPPTGPISSVANTKLLCCKSNSSATAFDVSPGTITANGNAVASNFNPFTVNINTQRGQESGYCTLNPLKNNSNNTLSNGNLRIVNSASSTSFSFGNIVLPRSGKYYFEALASANGGETAVQIGVFSTDHALTVSGSKRYWYLESGGLYDDGSLLQSVSTYGNGDLISAAYNADASTITWYKNGVQQGTAVSVSTSYDYVFGVGIYKGQWDVNFGQKPFKFPPPSGFQPLALANTPRPTIVRPDQYVGIVTYSGNSAARSLSVGFKPDLVWIKGRSLDSAHHIFDSVRGPGKRLISNGTQDDTYNASDSLTGFISQGFTLGADSTTGCVNTPTNTTYVAWCWKAGGNSNTYNINDVGYATASAAGLTAGTITPSGASVNTKSGFSIITYTGNETQGATVAHGLQKEPAFIIIKRRTGGSTSWLVGHKSLATNWGQVLYLNLTDGQADQTAPFNDTAPTSSVWTMWDSSSNNASGSTYVAYCWAEIPGFSKFGSFTGSSDLPFIHTGFKPRWLLIKNAGVSGDDWAILDSARNTYNEMNSKLWPNTSAVEATLSGNNSVDFLANGFKMRSTNNATNSAGNTMIYAAFAETPSFNLYGGQANAR